MGFRVEQRIDALRTLWLRPLPDRFFGWPLEALFALSKVCLVAWTGLLLFIEPYGLAVSLRFAIPPVFVASPLLGTAGSGFRVR